ncbi:gastrokine-1-like [Podarcis raffonei]|uniref:gastrokine-1-like n=1 Tax=Podarcis raffonei TaxID=65483 RepID=UPI0023296249|nr:gastrokine-1-like [Podarcis raffonei]
MKLIALSVALLGVLLAPALAVNNISENNQGNVGGHSHQSVSIDNQKQVVNVDNNNGWHSWNNIWDYGTGYMATRILSKKSCILTKMNRNVMPDVTTLPEAIKEKQKDRTKGPAPKKLTYMVTPKKITNLAPYGKNIEALCRGIPTYAAYEFAGESSGACFQANILWILHISLCGGERMS